MRSQTPTSTERQEAAALLPLLGSARKTRLKEKGQTQPKVTEHDTKLSRVKNHHDTKNQEGRCQHQVSGVSELSDGGLKLLCYMVQQEIMNMLGIHENTRA